MNEDSIGADGGQVAEQQQQPLDLSTSADPSPTLTAFSFHSQANTVPSLSDSLKSPVNLTLCSVAIILVAGLWLTAGYFIQALTPVYDSPSMLAYLSVISLQVYFFFIPKRPNYLKTRADGTILMNESDLGFDTYTNREVMLSNFLNMSH